MTYEHHGRREAFRLRNDGECQMRTLPNVTATASRRPETRLCRPKTQTATKNTKHSSKGIQQTGELETTLERRASAGSTKRGSGSPSITILTPLEHFEGRADLISVVVLCLVFTLGEAFDIY